MEIRKTGSSVEIGFLLAHDTPHNNYRGNAVDLYYLNLDAHEISVGKKAKFVIILDACHSGHLAGDDVNGRINASANMKLVSGKEVRILSCQSDEKSLEVADLGGGRGIFSYYLVRGLVGEADKGQDLQVTRKELGRYLQQKVEEEAENRGKSQLPEVTGDYDFRLSFVDEVALAALENEEPNSVNGEMMAMADQPVERSVTSASNKEYPLFDNAIKEKLLLYPANYSAYHFYNQLLNDNSQDERLPKLKSQLIVALQDEAQRAINAYLRGEQSEINRRLYISKAEDYVRFPAYLEKAAELAGENYPNYNEIKAKQYYFEGINARLKATQSGASLNHALSLQKKASGFIENAAYIQNEIGVILLNNGDTKNAEKQFKEAIEISPTWAIPYSNLCELYLLRNQFDKAEEWAQKAIDLQPDLRTPYTKMGYIFEQKKNYLKAEEYYRTALKLDWNHYSSFENLAYTYTLMGDYALADHLFLESDIRKKDVFPPLRGMDLPSPDMLEAPIRMRDLLSFADIDEESELTKIKENPYDYEAWYQLGGAYLARNRLEEAEQCFKKVLFIAPNYQEVYQVLGDMYIAQERYHEALEMYQRLFEKDTSLAPKIWGLLEKIKRYDEAEKLIKQYGNENDLYHFYSFMIVTFPKHPTYWFKRASMLYEAQEKGDSLREYEYVNHSFDGYTGYLVDYNLFYEKDECWQRYVIADFEKVIELESDHTSNLDIHLKLGALYEELSEFYKNDVFLKDRIREYASDRTQYDIYLGFLERIKKAVKHSEKAYELTDSAVVLAPVYQLIDQYLMNFHYENALVLLEDLVKDYRLDFENRQKLIRIYILTNQLDKAKAMLDWTFERPFGNIENTNVLRGLYFRLTGEYEKSIESFQMAMKPIVVEYDFENKKETTVLSDKRHFYQYKIATLHALNGDKKEALEALELAIKMGFNFTKVLAYDPDLKAIRSNEKYQKLLTDYQLENKTEL